MAYFGVISGVRNGLESPYSLFLSTHYLSPEHPIPYLCGLYTLIPLSVRGCAPLIPMYLRCHYVLVPEYPFPSTH